MGAVAALPSEDAGARAAEQTPRLGVLWVPDWPVVAAMAQQQIPVDLPVAVHDARGIVAASAPARALGVRRGMRRRSAQELCPELLLVPADTGRDVRTFEEVVQACDEVVADLEVIRPGMVLFASPGPSRYAGGDEALGAGLVGAVAEQARVECQVGIAEGYLAAVLAAREGVVVPPGQAREYLAGRDVRSLLHAATTRDASAAWSDLVDLLRRLGLVRLGDVAALRTSDVAARFGDLGVRGQRLARGLDARRPSIHRPDPDVAVTSDLDPPAARIDTAAFAARRLAEDLQSTLLRRGAICGRLEVTARTTTGAELVRTWRIDGALTARELTDRVRWQLEGWLDGRSGRAPSAPLSRIEIAAREITAAGAAQEGLWGRQGRGQVQAQRAALRVQGLLGAERVLVPVPEGGRTPRDRVRMVAWGDEAAPRRRLDAPWPGRIPPPLPTVIPVTAPGCALVAADGTPIVVNPGGALVPAESRHTHAGHPHDEPVPALLTPAESVGWLTASPRRVRAWAGPWPVSERWWNQGSRGAWLQVEVERHEGSGVVLLVHRQGAWWVEGVHD